MLEDVIFYYIRKQPRIILKDIDLAKVLKDVDFVRVLKGVGLTKSTKICWLCNIEIDDSFEFIASLHIKITNKYYTNKLLKVTSLLKNKKGQGLQREQKVI